MDTVSMATAHGGDSRGQSAIGFPAYALADSVAVADAVHNKGGGYATREQVAAFLGYKSTHNGAFMSRISAAKMFGLVIERQGQLSISEIAAMILMPESADKQRAALVTAFLSVPLFKA